MTLVGVYLFTVLTGSAGLLGHPPVLASMTHRAAVWALQRATRDRRRVPARHAPSWARKEGR
ncbi:hypothetical protein [Streptomyces hokutonensis]|uniref:hypothetical protein n=1 Tax=Streptomyces hokutonensis TaxID=1306990 RepID=UPI0036A6ACB5